MYNRYIPQADGSFQRNRIPEPESQKPPIVEQRSSDSPSPQKQPANNFQESRQNPPPVSRPKQPMVQNQPKPYRTPKPDSTAGSIGGFFKGLLPENLDTEDLIVILLLLLMSSSNSKDPNAALLTLGIYLFM